MAKTLSLFRNMTNTQPTGLSADITFSFTPTTSDDYQLAINPLSGPNANFIHDSMAVKELAGQNMIATAIPYGERHSCFGSCLTLPRTGQQ